MRTSCKYCEFKVVRDLPRVLYERCVKCGRKVFYNKSPSGRIDTRRFLRDHVRDFCQPFGVTQKIYEEVYGRERLKERRQMVRENLQEATESVIERGAAEAKLALKAWHQLKARGYTESEIEKLLT